MLARVEPCGPEEMGDSSQNQDCPKTVAHVLAARSPPSRSRSRLHRLGGFVVGTFANPEMETRQDSSNT